MALNDGSTFSESFAPTDMEGLTWKGSERKRPMECVSVRVAPDCPTAIADALLKVLTLEELPPPQEGSGGRTLVLKLGNDRVKLKGAAGIEYVGRDPVLRPPKPDEPYANNQPCHLGVAPDLSMRVVTASPRYLRSLTAGGAKTEFDAHEALSAIGLSTRPLIEACFAETDGSGRQTGCIATHLPTCPKLGDLTGFPYVPAGRTTVTLPTGGVAIERNTVMGISATIAARIASARKRALFVAGIGRHSGHHGNIFMEKNGDIQLMDLDSVVHIDAMAKPERSAQVLRDLTSDMVRMISAYIINFHAVGMESAFQDATLNPVRRFLDEIFGDATDSEEISAAADFVTVQMQSTMLNSQDFRRAHANLVQAMRNKDMREFQGMANFILLKTYTLWPSIMYALHVLMQRSEIPRRHDLEYSPSSQAQRGQWVQATLEFIQRIYAANRPS